MPPPRMRRKATEQRSLQEIVTRQPQSRTWVRTVMRRLERFPSVHPGCRILEIGAAAGENLVALGELGYGCIGVEPWAPARANATALARHLDTNIDIIDGRAEQIPLDSGTFDVVLAFAVMEHVLDLEQSMAEISRVLKPGGVFWFSSASAMSPLQNEISGFPLFGWYPDTAKRRIMCWAKEHRPHLIGHTATPAIHWFTPAKASASLHVAGFDKVYDRWELRRAAEGGTGYRRMLTLICMSAVTRLVADICVPGCSYAATKSGPPPRWGC